MRRALALVAICACSLRNPRVDVQPCSSSRQCDQNAVCFLGECRPHSSALSLVVAEVQPPNTSSLGTLQLGGIDLQQAAVQDFTLVAPLTASGTVAQVQDANAGTAGVPGAAVTFTEHAPPIPDRSELVSARTDSSGAYAVTKLPQGFWDVVVEPPAPLPPYRPPEVFSTTAPQLAFTLPSTTSLVRVQTALVVGADGGPIPGENVTAVDSAGMPLSSPSLTQADGGFSLLLPPGTTGYFLQVGPPPDGDGGTVLPNYDQISPGSPVAVELPPIATLQGQVVDSTGAAVPAARVYARHEGPTWKLARSTTADSNGGYSLTLREGLYSVEAAPPSTIDTPAVSPETSMLVSATAPATLNPVCPPKVRAFGLITRADGTPVAANFQITATRLADDLITTRTAFSTPTTADGFWHVTADPGRYRVEIVPTADSGLPRKVVQIDLPGGTSGSAEFQMPTIVLSPPLVVGGTVTGGGQVVVNATVSFFAVDSTGHGVLLGTAPTDSKGHYTVVLPDVAQPGAVAGR
ncbi:MAG: carboxypeptidase-like regulatory domain-containing protein [Myxococcales bacterium]|nr:carboxypeptidase-like regulatory domain-containing protein [Myxococcales bacterium]